MKPWKWTIPIIALILLTVSMTHLLFFNIYTHSLPYGVYIRKGGTPHIGDYGVSCLTREVFNYGFKRGYLVQGNCDTGSIEVLKVIKGLPGDTYSLKDGILSVNGGQYPLSPKDTKGRPLDWLYRTNSGILNKNQYILISTFAKNSWDSRYWGPVPIKYIVQPLWIFENEKQN